MPAVPYCGPAPLPGAAIGAWNFDPLLLAALALAAWFLRPQPRASQAGLGLLVLAYVSPICSLSSGLFSVRAAHHLLVVYAAAPLLAGQLARLPVDLSKVPLSAALVLHVAVMWAWHLPLAYGWALSSDLAYWLGQVALLGSALLEEFQTRGCREKEVAHLDPSARLQGDRSGRADPSPLDAQLPGLRGIAGSAGQSESRDGTDRRQRFPAKAVRTDLFQVMDFLQFAGGMSFERHQGVRTVHSAAVISNLD